MFRIVLTLLIATGVLTLTVYQASGQKPAVNKFPHAITPHPQQQAQITSDQTSEGVRLYEQGDTDGAIKALREAVLYHRDDARAWHYLGLALIRKGDLNEAREALSEAILFRNMVFNRSLSFGLDEVRDDQLLLLKTLLHDLIESHSKYL